MSYTIKSDIVVPNGYVYSQSGLQPGFHQIHMHSTGNATATVQNERDYLAGHYSAANYTHLVGITNGVVDIRQVMNVNGGAWDVGGDWNWEAYAAIEFAEGSIRSQTDFNKAYPAYIWLARYLAKQAGITYTIDNLNTIGIKSHNYASATGHGSDHIDPIPFLSKWGVSRDKFNHDLINGIDTAKVTNQNGGIEMFANIKGAHYKQGDKIKLVNSGISTYGNKFTAGVLCTWGKVVGVRKLTATEAKKFKHSGFSYTVAFHYANDLTIWNIPGEYMRDAK